MPHAAPLRSLPQGVPMDAGHFARYCPQELEVRYLSASEQEELLIQLLAAWDATGTPSPDAPIAVHSEEVANGLEEVPTESEDF
ncbi:hypothetical protein C0989_011027 [Termitomyces sp. Mn162]|nr:hypothetical protein C0989_011027 [Termitomyces sp. Mn162]